MRKRYSLGFTLIEMLIVIAIIGILAAIAFPNYMEYLARSRRGDGRSALLQTSQTMERYFTENMSYNAAPAVMAQSTAGYYTITFDANPTSATVCGSSSATNPQAAAYRICAAPTGAQTGDSCGTMSLSNTGAKTPTTSGCW